MRIMRVLSGARAIGVVNISSEYDYSTLHAHATKIGMLLHNRYILVGVGKGE